MPRRKANDAPPTRKRAPRKPRPQVTTPKHLVTPDMLQGDGIQRRRAVQMGDILEARKKGANETVASQSAGIARSTLYTWLKDGEAAARAQDEGKPYDVGHTDLAAFYREYHKAYGGIGREMLGIVLAAARSGSEKAAIWVLENGFGYKQEPKQIELTGKNGGAVEFAHSVEPLPPSRIAELIPRALPEIFVEREAVDEE